MPFVCVLSYIVSGRGPDILLITNSERLALVCLSIGLQLCKKLSGWSVRLSPLASPSQPIGQERKRLVNPLH